MKDEIPLARRQEEGLISLRSHGVVVLPSVGCGPKRSGRGGALSAAGRGLGARLRAGGWLRRLLWWVVTAVGRLRAAGGLRRMT